MPVCCCCCRKCCSKRKTPPPKLPPYSSIYFKRRPWNRTTPYQLKLDRQSAAGVIPMIPDTGVGRAGSYRALTRLRQQRKLFTQAKNEREKIKLGFKWDLKTKFTRLKSLRKNKERRVKSAGTDLDEVIMEFEQLEEAKILRVNKFLSSASARVPMEGQILKFTNVVKGFQYRWFVLNPESGLLEYFEKEEHKKMRPRGSIHLAAAVVSPSEEDSQTFIISAASGEIYKLRAADAKERQLWVDRIRSTAEYHTASLAQLSNSTPPQQQPSLTMSPPSPQQTHSSPTSMPLHPQNAATSASNSLLAKDSSRRIRGCHTAPLCCHQAPKLSHSSLMLSPGPKDVTKPLFCHQALYAVTRPQSNDILIEVKDYLMEAEDCAKLLEDKIATLPPSGFYINSLDSDILMLKATAAATLQCIQDCMNILYTAEVIKTTSTFLIKFMPIQSAVDSSLRGGTFYLKPTFSAHRHKQVTSPPPHFQMLCYFRLSPWSESLPNIDDEVLDAEVHKDNDLVAVEEHKSVILHLLSQLKLGMDLTKVVLPTFILEKRSLLEMFADYMCHPDLFLKIPEIPDPEKRMLAVLEWYLSAFHVGKQGSVAKKPYNPIIGETFHCSWKLPTQDNKQQTIVYTAEQVSHHPPVSAFYFGSPDSKVNMNASIYTKSKFMGMSIGVSMVGKVRLRFEDLGEDYVFGMPSAYARSILTVPWVELGDKVSIVCEKTGYTASIVFHTKPFYGGKLHHITAEAKNNKTGEVICKVQGEWNGIMEFTYSNGSSKQLDVNTLQVHRKRVRPLEKQKEYESRKLWQHVTKALSQNNVTAATEHKKILEEIQRGGEKHRLENNISHQAKYFRNVDGVWVFKKLSDDFANDVKKLSDKIV
ncbi:unnamed protein product [Lymnaea stagnalis]|uniref:Oxysterol-binding protein n=1 Tax=Lymnaea stagnalis TaxID=6523 RepID=A0AAV2HR42_LYMST